MKSQAKAIVNYSVLLKELTQYQHAKGYTKQRARKCAEFLSAEIKRTWGSKTYSEVIDEKQLLTMTNYCKQHSDIKHLIFDYSGRFAKNNKEFEERLKLFRRLGVQVVFLDGKAPSIPRFLLETIKKLKEVNYEQ